MNMVWHRTHRIAVLVAMGALLGMAQIALAGDCNSNGMDDADDIALGTSQDCNLNTVPDECELLNNDCNHNAALDECEINIGPMELLEQAVYPVGASPEALVVVDLNGDNEPDVAVANKSGNTVSILLNLGDGTLLNASTLGVGSLPTDITAGDFDDDDDIDLAVTNFGSKSVTILLNTGVGSFFVGSTIDLGDFPWGLTTVDLDGDNNLDLAVAIAPIIGESALQVWVNDGSAGFSAGATAAVGEDPRLVVWADLDGDDDNDLIVANRSSNDISVLFNNGDATFAPTVTYAVDDFPLALVAVDLDGDFDVDVAVVNWGPDTVSLLTNDGAGNLEITQTLPVGADPLGIVAVDLNGNGLPDLATADSGVDTISILMNAGEGGYALLGSYCAGSSPSAIGAGDFGGAGVIDLLTANGDATVSVLGNIALADCLDCDGNRRIDSCEVEPFAFGFEAGEGFRVGDIGGQQAWFRGRIVEEFAPPPDEDDQIFTIACPDRQEIRFDNVDCVAATVVSSSPIGTGMALKVQVDPSLDESASWAVFSPNSTQCNRSIFVWEWDTYITNLDGPDFNVWIQDQCQTGAAAVLLKYEFDGDVRRFDFFFQGFINTGFTFEPGETFSTRVTLNLNSGFVTLEFNNDPDTISFFSTQVGSGAQEIAFENDNFSSDPPDEDAAYFDNISMVSTADCNGNGIDDLEDIASGASDDTNGDNIPDECQEDCNDDGELDPNDCNENCVIDECDLLNGTSLDCNANDIPDLCDVIGETSDDCNHNDIPDECDIDSGSSEDANDNGIPDECETDCEGDANGDGLVDPLDSGFILARFGCIVGGGDPLCDIADQNGDGLVDPLDVGFVLARFGPCP